MKRELRYYEKVAKRAKTAEQGGRADLLNVFQDLYDSEINFAVSTFWDGGFDVKLGDGMNGFVAIVMCETMIQAAAFLRKQTLIHFPDSTFSKKYQNCADEG